LAATIGEESGAENIVGEDANRVQADEIDRGGGHFVRPKWREVMETTGMPEDIQGAGKVFP
jgi:hypothetical protein